MSFFETADPDFLINEDQLNHPVRKVIAEKASKLGKTILDAGCNVGMSYPTCKEQGLTYTGIDFMVKFVKRAKELHPDGDFRPGDVLDLKFPRGVFDVVFCKDVLEHLPWPCYKEAIREMWRVADKGMMLSFFNASTDDERKVAMVMHGAGFWNNTYSSQELEKVIKSLEGVSSFSVQKIEPNQVLYTVYRVDNPEGPAFLTTPFG